jgi:hypothetical protein
MMLPETGWQNLLCTFLVIEYIYTNSLSMAAVANMILAVKSLCLTDLCNVCIHSVTVLNILCKFVFERFT